MQIGIIILGLILDIIGVIILTVYSDKTFIWILKQMNRIVDEDWNKVIEQGKKEVRKTTGIGVTLLVLGFIFQIIGNLYNP